MPSLRIKLPNAQGEITHVLSGERITIGRRPDNTIQIVDGTVSGHHAEFIGINGHYRLHDLGSTNLTCVDGEPVTDFHLHGKTLVRFGSIEAEYSPETPGGTAVGTAIIVPTRAELDFLRRENKDLQTKNVALEKQVEILGSARLMTNETAQLGVHPDAHRRTAAQRDELLQENAALKIESENLKCDIAAIARDRDALRQAWKTVKGELAAAVSETAALRNPPHKAGLATPAVSAPITEAQAPVVDQHRQFASVLTRAPGLVESIRQSLEKIVTDPADDGARADLVSFSKTLADGTTAVEGHPIQRIAAALDALVATLAASPLPPNTGAIRTLSQAADLLPFLLDPRALKRAREVQSPRVLAIESDQILLATIVATLDLADLDTTGHSTLPAAVEELRGSTFDLILVDASLPGHSLGDIVSAVRAIPGCEQTPLVSLTTPATDDEPACEACADAITKPINPLELTLKTAVWVYKYQFGLL